ncbi:MAG: hypothetical protein JWO69_1230 [Thermoleophilia bacterium]|nr:hypothetical protein [Thermoleophilia bacterium]
MDREPGNGHEQDAQLIRDEASRIRLRPRDRDAARSRIVHWTDEKGSVVRLLTTTRQPIR